MKKTGLIIWILTMLATAQAQFTFTTNNGSITITGYTGTNVAINIPDTINSYPVTAIGHDAFAGGFGFEIQSVTMTTNIIDIGENAFMFCIVLTNLNLPNALQNIESYALYGCYRLPSVTIPDNVTNIGNYAFLFCTNLTHVTLGASITSIGADAFFGCYRAPELKIPSSVTTIGSEAFEQCDAITSLTIPPSVTNIGARAFGNCSNLKSVCFECNASANFGPNLFVGNLPGRGMSDPITNIFYAEGTTGWSPNFQGIPTIPCAECSEGALQIWIEPTNAVTAGALWQVDEGNWETNGAIVAVAPGNHTVQTTTLAGWYNPSNPIITVSAGLLNVVTLTYQQPGALQIDITPVAATTAGAQWSIDEITWHNNGDTLTNLAPANYTVAFSDLAGWGTPDSQIVGVNANQTTETTGTYLTYGTIQLSTMAPSLVTNAQPNQCYLRAAVLPNQEYQVEYTEDLISPTWIDLTPILAPTNNIIRISDTATEPMRFYRIIQP